MRVDPFMAVVFACAVVWAVVQPADARGGGGNGGGMGGGIGGGAGMGAGRAGMPASSNAGGRAAGLARAGDGSGDQDQGQDAGGTQSVADGKSAGEATNGQVAAALGALNASHASHVALAHASPRSRVGRIAAYDSAMLAALAMPTDTPAEIAAQDAAIANARATLLAAASNKPLTATVVATVDSRLGLPATDPTLGVSQ